ncbi:hypothetical protein L483_25100 [Pseudomonas putida H8234]|nr:hypothetical protein L483_25100 [Pseudomonas putida H8234]
MMSLLSMADNKATTREALPPVVNITKDSMPAARLGMTKDSMPAARLGMTKDSMPAAGLGMKKDSLKDMKSESRMA